MFSDTKNTELIQKKKKQKTNEKQKTKHVQVLFSLLTLFPTPIVQRVDWLRFSFMLLLVLHFSQQKLTNLEPLPMSSPPQGRMWAKSRCRNLWFWNRLWRMERATEKQSSKKKITGPNLVMRCTDLTESHWDCSTRPGLCLSNTLPRNRVLLPTTSRLHRPFLISLQKLQHSFTFTTKWRAH